MDQAASVLQQQKELLPSSLWARWRTAQDNGLRAGCVFEALWDVQKPDNRFITFPPEIQITLTVEKKHMLR